MMKPLRKIARLLAFGTLGVLVAGSASAQNQCSDFVVTALNQMGANCNATDRNQACYGYFGVDASAVGGVNNFFTAPGNIAGVERLMSVRTRPYNPAANEWGIALMRLQANIPGTLPGQNVTFVMIGEASVLNGGGGAPLQSFVLNTGLGRPTCDGVPVNSVTLQGPQNINVAFNINGANFNIGSTVIFRTTENGLRVSTADGHVESGGVVIPAGFSRDVALDEDGLILEDTWGEPEIFDSEELETLEFLEDFPDDVFAYGVDLPEEDELALLAELDFDAVAGMDGYLLDDLLGLMLEYGLTPDDVAGATLDDLFDFAFDNLDFLDMNEDMLAALAESFGLDDAFVDELADAYGLDAALVDAYLNDDYDDIFADEADLSSEDNAADDASADDAASDEMPDDSVDDAPVDEGSFEEPSADEGGDGGSEDGGDGG